MHSMLEVIIVLVALKQGLGFNLVYRIVLQPNTRRHYTVPDDDLSNLEQVF